MLSDVCLSGNLFCYEDIINYSYVVNISYTEDHHHRVWCSFFRLKIYTSEVGTNKNE